MPRSKSNQQTHVKSESKFFAFVTVVFLHVVILLDVTNSYGENWARFRGPGGSGKTDAKVPVSWTPKANLAWKTTLPGSGVSSPIVVGNQVFVTCYSGYGLDREDPGEIEDLTRHLVCVDATTGKQLWRKDVTAIQPEDPFTGIGVTAHGYASHTPVSDGERVYVYYGKTGAIAYDLSGTELWRTSLGTESDPWSWGSSSSPIVHDNLLIVTASAESQAIVGLDKMTGEEVWRQEASGLDGMWGTPTLVKTKNQRTDLVMSVPREIWGLDPATGKLRWYCEATGAEQAHSSLIAAGQILFAFTGRGGGSVAVKAGGEGDVTDSNVIWTGRDSARFGSPVGHKTSIYLVSNGVLNKIDAKTGKRLEQTRLSGGSGRGRSRFGGLAYASPVIAGDHLYYLNGKGEMFVFELGEELKQLSINLVTTDSESFGGTPAISNDRMFLRSNKHLYCVADTGSEVQPNASSNLIAKADPEEQEDAPGAGRRRGRGRPGGGFRGRPGGERPGGRRPGGRGRGGFGRESREDNRPDRPARPEPAE